ncbi:MAG: hypothetical protein ACKVJE_22440, partial [Pseudomonadales bacterium]
VTDSVDQRPKWLSVEQAFRQVRAKSGLIFLLIGNLCFMCVYVQYGNLGPFCICYEANGNTNGFMFHYKEAKNVFKS